MDLSHDLSVNKTESARLQLTIRESYWMLDDLEYLRELIDEAEQKMKEAT